MSKSNKNLSQAERVEDYFHRNFEFAKTSNAVLQFVDEITNQTEPHEVALQLEAVLENAMVPENNLTSFTEREGWWALYKVLRLLHKLDAERYTLAEVKEVLKSDTL
jgi:hypothetical protein